MDTAFPATTDQRHASGMTAQQQPYRSHDTRSLLHTRSQSLFVLLGYGVFFCLLYSPVLVVSYDFIDSYTYLAEQLQGTLRAFDVQAVSYGRPVYGLLVKLALAPMQTIDDLRILRLVAVLGLAVLAWLIYRTLRLAHIRQPVALAIPVILCTLPPYEIWVSWTVCAFYLWAAALAGWALLAAEQALRFRASWHGWLLFGLSGVLLLLAMMIYQPAAMVFLVFAAIVLFCRPGSLKQCSARFLLYSGMAVVTLGIDGVLAKTLPTLLYGGTPFTGARTQLVENLTDKATWFLQEALLNALNLWNLLPGVPFAWCMALFSLGGLLLFWRGPLLQRVGKAGLALILIPLSYLPSLLVEEDWAAYRTQVALMSLLALYAAVALIGYVQHLPWQRVRLAPSHSTVAALLLVVVGITGSGLAITNVTEDMVLPQAEELHFLASSLNQNTLATATSIYVIPCAWSDGIAPVVRYDEFGLPSCSAPWAPGPMVYLLLRQFHPAQANLPIVVALSGATMHPPPGSLVIDMRLLRQERTTEPQYH